MLIIDEYFVRAEQIFHELKYIKQNIGAERKFRGKCGEIYLENGIYLIRCFFCEKYLVNIRKLLSHIYQDHLKLKVPDDCDALNEKLNMKSEKVKIKTPESKWDPPPPHNSKIKLEFLLIESYNNENLYSQSKKNILEYTNKNNNILNIPNIQIKSLNKFELYSCNFCTKTYKHYSELENHFLVHTNSANDAVIQEKPQSLSEKGISVQKKIITENSCDNNSVDIDSPNFRDDKFCCKLCDRTYLQKRSFRKHFKQIHSDFTSDTAFKAYKCADCTSSFHRLNRYEAHRRWHNRKKPYKCKYCPKTFFLKGNYTTHENSHLGIKPYSCKYCDKKFTQPNSQKAHERNVHTKDRPHQCEHCGRSFAISSVLKEHKKRHTNTKPFKCKICSKAFYNNYYLNIHLNRHTGAKTYDCNMCDMKFTAINTLKTHKQLHSDIKQYECKLCFKRFAQFPGLYAHMRNYHAVTS